jgi:hypothetical protein
MIGTVDPLKDGSMAGNQSPAASQVVAGRYLDAD